MGPLNRRVREPGAHLADGGESGLDLVDALIDLCEAFVCHNNNEEGFDSAMAGRHTTRPQKALLVFDQSDTSICMVINQVLQLSEHFWKFTHDQRNRSPPILAAGSFTTERQPNHLQRVDTE